MPKSTVPSYTLHKPTGQARVRIRGKDHWLVKHGSPESYEKYARLIHDWQQAPKTAPPSELTVGQLAMIYMQRCRRHYRKAGEVTSEVSAVKIALDMSRPPALSDSCARRSARGECGKWF